MKKLIFIIPIVISIFSCTSRNLINGDEVTKFIFYEKDKKISIENKDSICMIANELNRAKKDPAIFISEYKIIVCYKENANMTVLCNSNRIKINGVTYKMNKSLKY